MQQTSIKKPTVDLETLRSAIATRIDSAGFTSWIAPLEIEITDNNVLRFIAQNRFSADFIRATYGQVLSDIAGSFGLSVILDSSAKASASQIANDNSIQSFSPATPVAVQGSSNSDAFDSFISSDENAFVLSACKKLAAGTASFSPLFIYGPAGCGKSLLANCISDASVGRVVKMSGSQFVSEFARALHDKTIFAFKDYCRNCDIFIMDDVQTLAGKRASCEEFIQLITDLRASGRGVDLTGDTAPSGMHGFDRRVQSILASGLVADVVAPTEGVRRTMLLRSGLGVDVAGALARDISSNGHIVSGVIQKIRAYKELMCGDIDLDVACRLVSDSLQRAQTPTGMVKKMCEKLGVSYEVVCGRGRSRAVVFARQVMMTVLHNATGMSLAEIGRVVGDRDHATVLYAISQIERQRSADLVLSAQISQLIAECK